MFARETRRGFLQTAAAGSALLGLGDLSFLSRLRPVSAAEARLDPKLVRLQPDIEPLVQLLEETPRELLLEKVAERIQRGLTYRELLAALLLAGVRNVRPRPSVGFKFHAVLVVNSAHLASLSSPDTDRWLPIFWALDYFKDAQASNIQESNWRMGAVEEARVPPAHKARQAFIEAMDHWDEAAADAAVAGLARSAGANEVFELFCRFGCRDFRDIGHKAIFVANSWRTLHCIGWQYAEPVLRSLAYALLRNDGTNPSTRDLAPDRPGRRNRELAAKIRAEWQAGQPSAEATGELLATLRKGSDQEACDLVVELLNRGVAPQSVWDALFLGAAELMIRQPAIVALHAQTTTNALNYAYQASGNDETRRLLMLQNAAFVVLFREAMKARGKVGDERIDQLEPAPLTEAGPRAVGEIFSDVSRNRMTAARKVLTYLKDQPQPKELIDAARVLIFLKGTNSHDYKYSSAVLEDYFHVSPALRDRFLAASMFNLRGSGSPDNRLVKRTRAALRSGA
jgi:hypothetical protein